MTKNFFKKLIAYILRLESQLVLGKYKPKVIAITGSVGKTSTKDAVYAVLKGITHVRKSEKSYNSEIGLPLTILGVPNGWNNPLIWLQNIFKGLWLIMFPHTYPEWLVLEVGVGKPGDMKKTASWLRSDVVIITAIGETPAHIEFFASRKSLIEEKSQLIKTLKKPARPHDSSGAGGGGLLILNADDEDVLEMKHKTKNLTITYGFKPGADVLASADNIFYDEDHLSNQAGVPTGVIFRIDEGGLARGTTAEGTSMPVVIEGVFGRNHVYASLAALSLSLGLKFNMIHAVEALKNYEVSPGRMRLLAGIINSLIIDDTYNSSPFACESALRTLAEIKSGGRKIAILGDMLELGKHTVEAHRNIGKIAAEIVDILIVVGLRAKAIKEGALQEGLASTESQTEAGMKEKDIFEFLDSTQATEFMKTFVQEHDLILVKGSQGMRMERVVEAILQDKENKNKLLVRQDKEWLEKK